MVKPTVLLAIYVVIQLVMFGVFLYLMTKVNPPKIPKSQLAPAVVAASRRSRPAGARTAGVGAPVGTTGGTAVGTTVNGTAGATSTQSTTIAKAESTTTTEIVTTLETSNNSPQFGASSRKRGSAQDFARKIPDISGQFKMNPAKCPLHHHRGGDSGDSVAIISPKELANGSLSDLLGPSEMCNETACVYRLVTTGDHVQDFDAQSRYGRLIPPLHPVKGFRRSLKDVKQDEVDSDAVMLKFLGLDHDGALLIEVRVGANLVVTNSLPSGNTTAIKWVPYNTSMELNNQSNFSIEELNCSAGFTHIIDKESKNKTTDINVKTLRTEANESINLVTNEEKLENSSFKEFIKEVLQDLTHHINNKDLIESHAGNYDNFTKTHKNTMNNDSTVRNEENNENLTHKYDNSKQDYERYSEDISEDLQNRAVTKLVNLAFVFENTTVSQAIVDISTEELNIDPTENSKNDTESLKAKFDISTVKHNQNFTKHTNSNTGLVNYTKVEIN